MPMSTVNNSRPTFHLPVPYVKHDYILIIVMYNCTDIVERPNVAYPGQISGTFEIYIMSWIIYLLMFYNFCNFLFI